jgi:hypothetical protein
MTDLPPFDAKLPLPREAQIWLEYENGNAKLFLTIRVDNGRSENAQKDRYMKIKEGADVAYHTCCVEKAFTVSRIYTTYNGAEEYSRKTTWRSKGKYLGSTP